MLLGTGVCAGVTLRKSYAADAGWMVITTGWALGVLCGVLVAQAFGSPGAHLNPAITLAAAVISGNYSQVLYYWSAQLLGAMGGASLMVLHYAAHWKPTPDPTAKLGIFCTNGAIRNRPANFVGEVIGTMVLVVVAGAIFSHGVSMTQRREWDRGWFAAWCGASASRSVAPRAMPSIRRGILAHGSSMRCCQYQARAVPTGAMHGFRFSATSQVVHSPACSCTMRIFSTSIQMAHLLSQHRGRVVSFLLTASFPAESEKSPHAGNHSAT